MTLAGFCRGVSTASEGFGHLQVDRYLERKDWFARGEGVDGVSVISGSFTHPQVDRICKFTLKRTARVGVDGVSTI